MKRNIYEPLRKVQLAFLTLTAFFPVAPWIFCNVLLDGWALHWVFTGLAFLFAGCSMLVDKKLRSLVCVAGIVVQVVLGILLLPGKAAGFDMITLLAVPALYSVALLIVRPMAEYPAGKEPHGLIYLVGILLYFVWYMTMASLEVKENYTLSPANTEMLILFLLFLALVMFSRNRGTLDSASQGRFYIPPSIHRVNWLLISVMMGAIIIVGALPFVGKILATPITTLVALFSGMLNWFWDNRIKDYTGGGQVPSASTILNSPLQTLMPFSGDAVGMPDIIMTIFLVAFLGIFLFIVIMVIIRLSKILIKVVEKVLSSSGSTDNDYLEELSDVRDTATSLKPKRRSLAEILQDRKPDEPGAQIRYHYKVLKRRHPKWRASETVRQQLSLDAAGLYERIRYGGKDATEEDAQAFETQTKGL